MTLIERVFVIFITNCLTWQNTSFLTPFHVIIFYFLQIKYEVNYKLLLRIIKTDSLSLLLYMSSHGTLINIFFVNIKPKWRLALVINEFITTRFAIFYVYSQGCGVKETFINCHIRINKIAHIRLSLSPTAPEGQTQWKWNENRKGIILLKRNEPHTHANI